MARVNGSLNIKTHEDKPLSVPAEASGPEPEYLAWHREEVFGKN